jgi:hypothetical protein
VELATPFQTLTDPSQRLVQLQIPPREDSQSLEQVLGGPIVESPVASRSPSLELRVQTQIQSALTDLRRLTKIPPALKVLNNQVKKINSSTPLRAGAYSDIWLGEWLGETVSQSLLTSSRSLTPLKVALKSVRILTDPKKASKLTKVCGASAYMT